jgi:hypothetical protein
MLRCTTENETEWMDKFSPQVQWRDCVTWWILLQYVVGWKIFNGYFLCMHWWLYKPWKSLSPVLAKNNFVICFLKPGLGSRNDFFRILLRIRLLRMIYPDAVSDPSWETCAATGILFLEFRCTFVKNMNCFCSLNHFREIVKKICLIS